MKRLFVFCLVIVAALSADITPEPSQNGSTTAAPTTPPTTSTTTTMKPTTPTTTPTTTTTTTTTTVLPPHTTTTLTTTTSKPTTAPTAPPHPKPKEPEVLKFNITSDNNITCIVAKMALMFKVPYETKENKTHEAKVIIPKEATVVGHCGDVVQNFTISWLPENGSAMVDNITIQFEKNTTAKKFMMSSITGVLQMDKYDFADAKKNETIYFAHSHKEFITSLTNSYKCDKAEYLNLTVPANVNQTLATFVISDLQIQAFRNSTTKDFSSAEDCEPFETSGIVPIAVGCALIILIIIVLVAYLIGRRRSQARGYLSM